jgi:hypothetical protein
MKEQLIDILGLRKDATEDDIVAAIRAMVRDQTQRTANAEFEQRLNNIMHTCHCTRENALLVVSLNDTADKQRKANAAPAPERESKPSLAKK